MGNITVRPLEWLDEGDGLECWRSRPDLGPVYSAEDDGFSSLKYHLTAHQLVLGTFNTLEAAKAAAQVDYEARVLSALSVPCLQEPVDIAVDNTVADCYSRAADAAKKALETSDGYAWECADDLYHTISELRQTHRTIVTNRVSLPALKEVLFWLRGALDCEKWDWSPDQFDFAEEAYHTITAQLDTPLYTQPIEVREQAIEALRPFARFSDVIEHNARHHASDQTVMFEQKGDEYGCLTLGDFRSAAQLLALLEGR